MKILQHILYYTNFKNKKTIQKHVINWNGNLQKTAGSTFRREDPRKTRMNTLRRNKTRERIQFNPSKDHTKEK